VDALLKLRESGNETLPLGARDARRLLNEARSDLDHVRDRIRAQAVDLAAHTATTTIVCSSSLIGSMPRRVRKPSIAMIAPRRFTTPIT